MNTTLFDLLDSTDHSMYGGDIGLGFDSPDDGLTLGMDDSETLASLSPEASSSSSSSPYSPPSQTSSELEDLKFAPAQQFQGMYFHVGYHPPAAQAPAPQQEGYPETLSRPTPARAKTSKDGLKASSKAKTTASMKAASAKTTGSNTTTPTPSPTFHPVYDPQQQFQQFAAHYPGYSAMQFPMQVGNPGAAAPVPPTHQTPAKQTPSAAGQFFAFTSAQDPAASQSTTTGKKAKATPQVQQPQTSFQFISETPYPAAKKGKTAAPERKAPASASKKQAPAPQAPVPAPAAFPPSAMVPTKQEVLTPPQTVTPTNFSSPVAAAMLITPPLSEHDISHSSNSSSSSENGDPQELSPSGSPTLSFLPGPNGQVSAFASMATKEEHESFEDDEDEDEEDEDDDDEQSVRKGAAAPKPLFDSFKISGANDFKVQVKEEKGGDLDKMQRHKKSERRRREKVNDSIATLRTIVPSLHAVQKPSKGTILLKTVEYVSRIQTKHTEATKQLAEAADKVTMQQNYINLLIQRLTEHNIPVPGSPEEFKQSGHSHHPASTQYFVQDAGRTMVLMAALLFFWYAPWHLPTMQGGGSSSEVFDVTSGRSLLSTPTVVFQMEGWLMFFVWIFIRWVVMTTLLTIALFSDTFYCTPEMKMSQEAVGKLNSQAKDNFIKGNYQMASRQTNEALLLLQRPIPNSSFDIFFGIIYQAGRQIAHRAYVGLWVDRLLTRTNGQVGYTAHLKETYLNLSALAHCLPNYSKWVHLYVLLCAVNLSEIADNTTAEDLVQAYSGLAYVVIIHSKVFEFFANIYMFLAFRIINRNEIECSRFGHVYLIVAYRNLLSGNFEKVSENLQKAMDTHKSFGLIHHFREALMMKAWIQYTLGTPRESFENFKAVYDSGNKDSDKDMMMWGLLGMIATLVHLGDNEKALEWLQSYNALLQESKASSEPNSHQTAFMMGFKASLCHREGNEEGALEVANAGLEFLKVNPDGGMPHNVLPLQKFAEVHLAQLEKFQKLSGVHAEEVVEKLTVACREDLEQMQRSVVLFPLMRPLQYLYQGRFIYLTTGDYHKAAALFEKCEDNSKKFALRYLVALAQFEWARIMPVDSVERTDKLEEALATFVDIEALYEEHLTRQEMKRKVGEGVVDRVFSLNYHDLS